MGVALGSGVRCALGWPVQQQAIQPQADQPAENRRPHVMGKEVCALHHTADGKDAAQADGEDECVASHARLLVPQCKKQREQGESGGGMTAWPAAPGFIGGRARAQQFAVGFLTAEFLDAPRALDAGDGFQRSDKRGRQPE